MNIQNLILFCGMQVIGLVLILLKRKFRTFPNFMLKLIFLNIFSHYIYYYYFYEGVITYSSNLAYSVVPFAAMAPLVVYYYVMSVLYGELKFTKYSIFHYVPLVIIGIFFVLFMNSLGNKHLWLFLSKNLLIVLYGIYPFIIIKMIGRFYGIKGFTFKVFNYNKKKTSLVKLLCYLMIIHFFLLLVKNNIGLFFDGMKKTMDIINICFLMFLGYAISYIIISEPKTIHLSSEKIGLSGFRKYDKSKTTRKWAEVNAKLLNEIMDSQKPYLDPEFSLSVLSKLSNISTYEISETLNGLIGQNFNDYVNNYRVEEFKSMLKLPEYRNFTILAIAFEAGFKSKATFNVAFKKFTGKTPSEYKKSL